jgi:predicted nucleotidyltransferase
MKWQKTLDTIVNALKTVSDVEGAFLGGSLANQNEDRFSDIDLGIVTRNSVKAFAQAYSMRSRLIAAAGTPLTFLDRGWAHCKMSAVLYGKSQFPPIGLEIDIIFSQLRHVSEQMPDSDYKMLFDRNGKLEPKLKQISRVKTKSEIEQELKKHLTWCAFYVHDAVKSCKRNDIFQAQSLLEEIRKLIFFAAGVRSKGQVYGTKHAYRYLSPKETKIIADSYCGLDEWMIRKLFKLYLECVTDLKSKYRVEQNIQKLQESSRQLL